MNAGRDLDMILAEKILGWSKEKVEEIDEEWFSPSTIISDAFQIIEKFDMYELHKVYDKDYTCWIYANGNTYEATAETIALALCRAALKVVEI